MSNVPLPQRLIRAVLRPLSSLLSLHQNRVVIVLAALVWPSPCTPSWAGTRQA